MNQIDSHFADFLITDYQQASETLLRNEEGGEKRATFFATLTGATFAVLGFILEPESNRSPLVVHMVLALALAMLLVFGWLTAVRLAHRNRTTDRLAKGLDRIRTYFADGRPDRLQCLAFNPSVRRTRSEDSRSWVRKGGWLETTFVINTMLSGALAATVLDGILLLDGYRPPLELRVLIGAIGASAFSLLLWVLQCSMRTEIERTG
jgi:hypothetical protein